jgi:hypothetical protein
MVDPALGSRGQIVGKVMDILLREVAYSLWVSSWSPPLCGGGHGCKSAPRMPVSMELGSVSYT